jgi:hypothetical protein
MSGSGSLDLALPDWLLDLIGACTRTRSTRDAEPRYPGGRNDHLFHLGRSLHWQGRSPAEIEDTLLRENLVQCQPPLPEPEVTRIIHSVPVNRSGFSGGSIP